MKRKSFVIIAFVVLLPLTAAWWAAEQLAHPPRRSLQDFHREFLADPAAHGVVLKSFTCDDGTPCLMCEPEPAGAIGKRGRLIREQLSKKGLVMTGSGKMAGTLVMLHGRRGRKEDYLLIAERFCAAGFRCLLPDLPAHGDHPAKIASYGAKEAELPARVLREAAAKFGFIAQPAGLMGLSMGGAVGIGSAAQANAPWRAIVLVSTFDTLENVVSHQSIRIAGKWTGSLWQRLAGVVFEWETGMSLSAADSITRVSGLKCPTLIAHGTGDVVIPMACGRRLYDALPAGLEKRWIEIPGADHDNVLITDFPIYAEMAEWMLRHVPE